MKVEGELKFSCCPLCGALYVRSGYQTPEWICEHMKDWYNQHTEFMFSLRAEYRDLFNKLGDTRAERMRREIAGEGQP